MFPVTDHSRARLLVSVKQAFTLHVKKRVAIALLALYICCSGWVLLRHHPFNSNKPARHNTVAKVMVADELEMFEVVRPEEGGANGIIALQALERSRSAQRYQYHLCGKCYRYQPGGERSRLCNLYPVQLH